VDTTQHRKEEEEATGLPILGFKLRAYTLVRQALYLLSNSASQRHWFRSGQTEV
jgi:hypothetical protein